VGRCRRLFGRLAAFFAAALFAVLGPTLHLGAFATYDAQVLFLVAVAAWCVVRAGDQRNAAGWMAAAGAALALANATAYSSVLFDVFMPAVALLTALPASGVLIAARRAAAVLIVAGGLLAAGLLARGGDYLGGFARTTLARVPGSASPLTVLDDSWQWAGLLVVLAACGIIISRATRQRAAQTWLLGLLAAAAVAGPLNQARLHSAAMLVKHVGLGAWFAAIAVGYAVDRFIAAVPATRTPALLCECCVVALVFPAELGPASPRPCQLAGPTPPPLSRSSARWPATAPAASWSKTPPSPSTEYYLPAGSQWQRWSSTRDIMLPSGTSTGGPAGTAGVTAAGNAYVYVGYIARGYFSIVALNFTDTTALDRAITADLRRNHHYRIVQVIPYGTEVPPSAWAPTSSGNTSPAPGLATAREAVIQRGWL
jgi:hypothetical protein